MAIMDQLPEFVYETDFNDIPELCYWAAVELGMAMVDPARRLDITPAAVSYAVQRGEKIARESGYGLGALNLRHTRLLQR